VFAERATHAYPPGFAMPPEWRPELDLLATELDFPLLTSNLIEERFLKIIGALKDA
jgi:hypothetical protein